MQEIVALTGSVSPALGSSQVFSVRFNVLLKDRLHHGQLQPSLFLISRFKLGRFNRCLDEILSLSRQVNPV